MNQKNGTSAKKGAPLDHAMVNAKATTKVFQNASEKQMQETNMTQPSELTKHFSRMYDVCSWSW